MADDPNQRPFRSADPAPRVSAAERKSPSGGDPLAELARLIGQDNPFGEYDRNSARRSVPPPAEPAGSWAPPAAGYQSQQAAAGFPPPPAFPPPQHDDAHDLYHTEGAAPGYEHADLQPDLHHGDYQRAGYDPAHAPFAPSEEEYYDDVPPRRRMGILAIAAVFALAVVGTAGAFGYRALFGTSSSGPPPVIKADAGPNKIVPPQKSSTKLITARITDPPKDEKVVPREELPVDIKKAPGDFAQGQANVQPPPAGQPALGSGVVGSEPKKVHTIVIRPDGAMAAEAPPAPPQAAPQPAPPPPPAADKRASNAQPMPIAPDPPAAAPPRHTTARTAPPPAAEPPRPRVSANAPLSLNPNAPAPPRAAPPAPAPMRTASVGSAPAAAPAPASGGSGYAVQLSSRRSEADAEAAFRSLQAKYPGQLGGKQPLIRRVDLGQKGIYFRAMVGPFASSEEASKLCSSLKAAGGACFIQKI